MKKTKWRILAFAVLAALLLPTLAGAPAYGVRTADDDSGEPDYETTYVPDYETTYVPDYETNNEPNNELNNELNNETNSEPDYIMVPGKKVVLTIGKAQALIDGDKTELDSAPYLKKTTTMVPLRFICQDVLDATVSWDRDSGNVTVSDGKMVVVINSAKGVASKDGVDYPLPQAPEEVRGRTFVPLRLIAELFECTVNYDSATKTITIITPLRLVYLPVPDFSLQESIVAGQKPVYADLSSDPEGGTIVDRIWRVSRGGASIEGRELSHLIGSRPEPGQYLVSLKVKSSRQMWSNWRPDELLTILPNQAPVIFNFRANKSSVDKGEGISFTFSVDNEPWEQIVEYNWSHTRMNVANSPTRSGLPRAFFEAGMVEVELVVKDAYGNESEKARFMVTVSDKALKSEMQFKFRDLRPGERFLNIPGVNFNNLPYVMPHFVGYDSVMTLLMSNNPERAPSAGILYQDKAKGPVRLSYSHLNTLDREMFIAVFAENAGSEPVTLTIEKRGLAGPSGDVLQVGQQVVANYFRDSSHPETIVIQPGKIVLLNREQSPIKKEQLLAGIFDVYCDAPLLFTTAAITGNLSNPSYAGLSPLDKERTHVRGSFENANLKLGYHVDGERREKIVLGREDAYEDHFLVGKDMMTGETIENKGNWAVMHEITISADRTVGLMLNPRGSIYRGALIGFDGKVTLITDSGFLLGSREAAIIGVIGAGEKKTLWYTAPGGSDAPILLVVVPENEW